MRRDDAIRLLKEAEPDLRARGVSAVSLFGSTARDEASADSDVDVLVQLDMSRRPGLVDLSGIRLAISDGLGREADVAIETDLRETYRVSIGTDAIRIF